MNIHEKNVFDNIVKRLKSDKAFFLEVGGLLITTSVKDNSPRVCDKISKKSFDIEVSKLAYREILDLVPDSDLSVDFDVENFDTSCQDRKLNKILGPFLLKGRRLIGYISGGDWEYPVYFVGYFQDGKWRIYIPKDGNVYNYDTMKAFGNGEDYDKPHINHDFDFLKKQFPVEMQHIEIDNYSHDEQHCELMLNVDKIKEDIINNISYAK